MSPDALDVVVVTYESASHLAACLRALPPSARVVVVDNASQDGSADLAAALGAQVVRNAANRGYTAAANAGARRGDREHVLFLNPDASVDERSLAALGRALRDDDRLAAAAPRLVYDDGSEQRVAWPFPSPLGTWREALGLHRIGRPQPGFVVGACLLVRRRMFEDLGGFDERFWLYGEEADFARRAAERGWRVAVVDGAVARHAGGASAAAARGLVFEHFQRGAEHFIAKHHGRAGLVAHRLGLLVGSALRVAPLALARDGRAATRRAIAARLLRTLFTTPGSVGR